jgi:integration host factor subunit beta
MIDGYMTKSGLILRLAKRKPQFRLRDAERIVDIIFDEITAAVIRGDRVELRGFGAFSVKRREARAGRNPSNGEIVHVPAKRLPHFRTGKALHDRLNAGRRP